MKRLQKQRRAGHANLQLFVATILLSLLALFFLFARANLKPLLKSLSDFWSMLALLGVWALCLLASILLLVVLRWIDARWPRPK